METEFERRLLNKRIALTRAINLITEAVMELDGAIANESSQINKAEIAGLTNQISGIRRALKGME